MGHDSLLKRIQFRYLGLVFAFTYRTQHRRLLGIKVGRLVRWTSLLLLGLAWQQNWGRPWLWLALLAVLWVQFAYWRADRAGYSKFVPDEAAVMPREDIDPLPADHRVRLLASGVFSTTEREVRVLLRPALYWQAPLGDHAVMVERRPGSYLYQFFDAANLIRVQSGRLLFGSSPHRTLAITFKVRWGPQAAEAGQLFSFRRDAENDGRLPRRTIYLTFENAQDHHLVWHNIMTDAPRTA
ncbi:MAG: hypothetical protein ACE5E7_01135 [Anaerolineae bacterium]